MSLFAICSRAEQNRNKYNRQHCFFFNGYAFSKNAHTIWSGNESVVFIYLQNYLWKFLIIIAQGKCPDYEYFSISWWRYSRSNKIKTVNECCEQQTILTIFYIFTLSMRNTWQTKVYLNFTHFERVLFDDLKLQKVVDS